MAAQNGCLWHLTPEQGRPDEALALLSRAVHLYGEEDLPEEHERTALLLALLQAELSGSPPAAEALAECPLPEALPELCARAALTAACLLRPELPDRAEVAGGFLRTGASLYPRMRDAAELFRLYRLEAVARALLGEREEARETLEGLRSHHLEQRDLLELALVSLDLVAFQVTGGEIPNVRTLERDLEGFDMEEGGHHVLLAFDRILSAPGKAPWASAWEAGGWLVRMLRYFGIATPAILFG